MKKIIKLSLSIFSVLILFSSFNSAMAEKPLDVIQMSNGYPSGPHYNLNIHGKSYYVCDPTEGGNSVFIREYGESTITYVTNRKSAGDDLIALDKCAEPFDGTPAEIQLPYEDQGYWVFATVKAKPNNSKNGGQSAVILSPNLIKEACNDTDPANPDFPAYTECPEDSLLALGLIVGENVYEATDVGLIRFDDQTTKGRGKSKAVDITDLFKWTGYVFDASLDANGDGVINSDDVPEEFDLLGNGGTGDGVIEEAEYDNWLSIQIAAGLAMYYENEWILNIADLTVTDQTISNDGVKLLKLRFYPVSTTYYE
jgi:hypothetical protein